MSYKGITAAFLLLLLYPFAGQAQSLPVLTDTAQSPSGFSDSTSAQRIEPTQNAFGWGLQAAFFGGGRSVVSIVGAFSPRPMFSLAYQRQFSPQVALELSGGVTGSTEVANESGVFKEYAAVSSSVLGSAMVWWMFASDVPFRFGVGGTVRHTLRHITAITTRPTALDTLQSGSFENYSLSPTLGVEYLIPLSTRSDLAIRAQIYGGIALELSGKTSSSFTANSFFSGAPYWLTNRESFFITLGAVLRIGW